MKLIFYIPLCLFFLISSCTKNESTEETPPIPTLADEKEITVFSFRKEDNPKLNWTITASIIKDSIKIIFPYKCDISALTPTITFKGKKITPLSKSVQNFNTLSEYIVTAENGTSVKYKVAIIFESPGASLYITSFDVRNSKFNLYSIDANSGFLKWNFSLPKGGPTGISFFKGILYFAANDNIIAFDTASRTIKWSYHTNDVVYSNPLVIDGVLYANCDDMFLYAINADTGDLIWQFKQSAPIVRGGNYSSPTFANGMIYFSSIDGYLYALNLDGTLKWKILNPRSPGATISSGPCVVNDIVYSADAAASLIAVDANSGTFLWEYRGSGLFNASPTVANGTLYIADSDKNLYAINALDGKRKWLIGSAHPIYSSPLFFNDVIFFGENESNGSGFYAVNSDGSLKWLQKHDYEFSSPVGFENTIFVSNYNSVLAMNAQDGSLKWKYKATEYEGFYTSAIIVDLSGKAYYPSISGHRQ